MAYPYLSDLINSVLGTQIHLPIATFGSFVALSIIVSTWVGKKEVIRFETDNILPNPARNSGTHLPAHQMLNDLMFACTISGILGARIFHILEHPREFIDNPASLIFSNGGFSFYGGLVFAFTTGYLFLKKRSIPFAPMLDALAPSMILGYGIGRIGCQVSGDGDWGIPANMLLKPNWLPDWLWAQTYENNIVGVFIQAPGVYPTPLYEIFMAFCIFSVLWLFRKRPYTKGYIFSIYLVLSGFERLLIEKIRVNSQYTFLDVDFTQAELISTLLILIGLYIILQSSKTKYTSKVIFSILVFGALSACSKL
ncbi:MULTISPECIES: prolipoprotein diacylglyceryl transferase [Methylomonas]|uniref:prolipoprotein diacylglyceryl transferase n=1 Tax=Methylomonas TaxID=416 RepID=UPI001231E85B|nr:prolipoprotein diacylglyceryl transferase family protein [Methylomonas rhizoryzae]